MFVDLDWPLNASSLLSASAELLVIITQPESWYSFTVPRRVEGWVFFMDAQHTRSLTVYISSCDWTELLAGYLATLPVLWRTILCVELDHFLWFCKYNFCWNLAATAFTITMPPADWLDHRDVTPTVWLVMYVSLRFLHTIFKDAQTQACRLMQAVGPAEMQWLQRSKGPAVLSTFFLNMNI